MWKIKDNIDLDILLLYDFKFYGRDYIKKVSTKNNNNCNIFYTVTPDRKFSMTKLDDGELDNTIYVLVKDNILEYDYMKKGEKYV